MQNKQIRQPGSQAESEIIRNCIRHRPGAEPNQSCRSALTVCLITALLYEFYHFFVFIHNVWKKKDWFYFEKTVVPGTAGCKAKCMVKVFHFRMQ